MNNPNMRDLESIVRELDARQQIHDVIMRYCRGTDHRHRGLLESVYHEGATDDHGFFSGSASDFIEVLMISGMECTNKLHIICNEYVEFDKNDPNVAYSETVTIGCMTRPVEDRKELSLSACRYLDRFECRDGEWRIAERKLVLDWDAKLPSTGSANGALTAGMLSGIASPGDASFGFGLHKYGQNECREMSQLRATDS